MSDLSPLDVLGKTFSKGLKGYPPREVHEFLTRVAATMEDLLRDRGELRQKVHHLESELSRFREREQALQDALVSAQRTAEATVVQARSEGQQLIDEGQNLAEKLVDDAQSRVQTIEGVVSQLRTRRREVRADLMRLVEVLEGVVRDDQRLEQQEPAAPQLALFTGSGRQEQQG